MKRPGLLRRLREEESGAILVEFALLAPMFLTLLFGVFHVGIYLQNYNALRSVVADSARYVTVEYQKGNALSESDIEAVIRSRAVDVPYMLDGDELTLVDVDKLPHSRVSGATELDIDVEYTPGGLLPFADLAGITLEYSRPVFVIAPGALPTP